MAGFRGDQLFFPISFFCDHVHSLNFSLMGRNSHSHTMRLSVHSREAKHIVQFCQKGLFSFIIPAFVTTVLYFQCDGLQFSALFTWSEQKASANKLNKPQCHMQKSQQLTALVDCLQLLPQSLWRVCVIKDLFALTVLSFCERLAFPLP